MTIPTLSTAELDALTSLRRYLHSRPELSNEESGTAAKIAEYLSTHSPDRLITGLGGHGVAAIYEADEPGETILLRCELDALPIQEDSVAAHRSEVEGWGHLCGHDGHMAILCAVAHRLAARRPRSGKAVLLFQPAEETGDGARAVLSDEKFAHICPDLAFALHNLPRVALGKVWIKQGAFACASRGARIRFTGRTAHSSQPETGVTPQATFCDFTQRVADLSCGEVGDEDFALVTVCHARLGDPAYGVLPGNAEIMVTLRSAADEGVARLAQQCEELARGLASRDGLTFDVSYAEDFAATVNDPQAVEIVERALNDLGTPYSLMNAPMRWSEDFGLFAGVAKSAMFGIGSGVSQPALHNPDFDFPDALIRPASDIFTRILQNRLG